MKAALICVTLGNNFKKLSVTLNSIYKNSNYPYHLFLIDNASYGETLNLYQRDDLPNTTLVRNPKNIWWGGGINQGIRLALDDDVEYIFFLNDDIELPAGWLIHFSNILSRHREIGAIGPISSSPSNWQGYDNVRRNYPQLRLPALEHVARQDLEGMNTAIRAQGLPINYIEGMLAFFCTGFRREAVEKAGFLDSDFFPLMCGDDNAYCMEIKKNGYKLALTPGLYVMHHSGASVNAIDIETRRYQKAEAARLLKMKYPEYYGPMVDQAMTAGQK
jgi:GT2 family glycosyltransferase